MTEKEVKEIIVQTVTDMQGGKMLEVVGKLPKEVFRDATVDIIELIDTLIKEGKLIEIEYVLVQSPYRLRSFLLPGILEVHIHLQGCQYDTIYSTVSS